jgi:aryl-alcohol dehydrogenase-like predicted oxidoreductase
MKISGKPEDVRRWCEESLRNLQVDYIDLYYQHRVRLISSLSDQLSLTSGTVGRSYDTHRRDMERA